jgi:hypothetical protein
LSAAIKRSSNLRLSIAFSDILSSIKIYTCPVQVLPMSLA